MVNDNLEETAKAIFEMYFVSFEKYGGNMPLHWHEKQIGDVVSVVRGASPRPIQDFISKKGVPWVKISDASNSPSKYLNETAEYIIEDGVMHSRKVKPGTMIVSNSASPGIPMIMGINACVHDGWLIIDDYKKVSQEYMYYHFLQIRKSLISSSNGSVFNNLKTDIVKSHKIIVPDIETMTYVTRLFRKINHTIKNNSLEIMSLRMIRDSITSRMAKI